MQVVQIQEAIYRGNVITGNFPLISTKPGDAQATRDLYLRIVRNGKEINVQANRGDYKISEEKQAVAAPAEDELSVRIARRFDIMSKLTEFVIKGDLRSLIISGAAGIGKSYNLEKRLNQAYEREEINAFTILKGKISAISLFQQLFLHKNKGDILVLDDIDVIFQDEVSLNLLKGALDTGDVRRLSWLTASQWLEEQGVDQSFEFEGACVFITNLDFDRLMERGSNLAPHFKALISRSIYLDLGIHTNKEILTRIKQVVNGTSMLDIHGIDNTQKGMMMDWMEDNYENLRELSLRSILKLAAFMKGDPNGWMDIAEATMVRNSGFTMEALDALVS